jgi:hypothetical protein
MASGPARPRTGATTSTQPPQSDAADAAFTTSPASADFMSLSPIAPLIDSATFPDVNPELEVNLPVVLHSGLTPLIELDSFDTPVSHRYSTVILC